jgi:hypothetical protein
MKQHRGNPKLVTKEQRIARAKARERLRYQWYFFPHRIKGYHHPRGSNLWYARITRQGTTVYQRCANKREARMKFLEWISRLRSGESILTIEREARATMKQNHSRRGKHQDNSANGPSEATPKVVGVCWGPSWRCWYAYIGVNGRQLQKAFMRYEDAVAQRRKWELKYRGKSAL